MRIEINIVIRDESTFTQVAEESTTIQTQSIPQVGVLLQGLVESVIGQAKEKGQPSPAPISSPISDDDIPF